MNYLLVAYSVGLLILGGYAFHLGRSLRRAEALAREITAAAADRQPRA